MLTMVNTYKTDQRLLLPEALASAQRLREDSAIALRPSGLILRFFRAKAPEGFGGVVDSAEEFVEEFALSLAQRCR